MRSLALLSALSLIAAAALAAGAGGHALRHAPHCRIFPKSNQWNQRVDNLPVASNSSAIVRSIGTGEGLHADFGAGNYGGGPIGIPYTTVSKKQHRVHVGFDYA